MNELIWKEPIKLKNCPTIDEDRIQEFISKKPKVLGLGDLKLIQREVRQKGKGFLDILFEENEETRYEVEVMLGDTDPSHIIRTIEYWINEKKRNPELTHIPVLVAERITNRFQDVINEFNKSIPMIAIQMTAYKEDNGDFGILFTKILDLSDNDSDDDLGGNEVTRETWVSNSNQTMVDLAEEVFNDIKPSIKGNTGLNFLQNYIGLKIDGISDNVISFVPKKGFIKLRFKSEQNEDIVSAFAKVGYDDIKYCARLGRKDYEFRIYNIEEYKTKYKNLLENIVSGNFN